MTLAEWEGLKEKEKEGSVEEGHEEVVIQADEGDMLDLKPLLSIQKYNFHPHFKTHTHSKKLAKDNSLTPKMVELSPYLNNCHLLNSRTNSFQQGMDDGHPPWDHP